mgnify:CR=1 FL=1
MEKRLSKRKILTSSNSVGSKRKQYISRAIEGEQELTSVDRISVSTDVISIQEVLRWRKEQRYELSIMGKLQNLIRHKSIMFCDIPYR